MKCFAATRKGFTRLRLDANAYPKERHRETLDSFILHPSPSSLLNYASLGGLNKPNEFRYFLAIGNQFPDLFKGLGGV